MHTYHVFPALHEFLVDDFAGIVFACFDVDGFLDDGVCTTSESLACAVLGEGVIRSLSAVTCVFVRVNLPGKGRLRATCRMKAGGRLDVARDEEEM